MSIRRNYGNGDTERDRLLRKADQESEMGCLALQDGDKADAERHFARMREYNRLAAELS